MYPISTFLLMLTFLLFPLHANPRTHSIEKKLNSTLKEFYHELHNVDLELQTLNQKIEAQDQALSQLQQQWNEKNTQQTQTSHSKWSELEQEIKTLNTHLSQITQAQEEVQKITTQSIKSNDYYRQHIEKLEKQNKIQEKNVAYLQDSLHIVMNILKKGSPIPSAIAKGILMHEVKSGDSLEKIAKKYHSTVAKIKTENQLKNDLIVIGQKLKIPKSS